MHKSTRKLTETKNRTSMHNVLSPCAKQYASTRIDLTSLFLRTTAIGRNIQAKKETLGTQETKL